MAQGEQLMPATANGSTNGSKNRIVDALAQPTTGKSLSIRPIRRCKISISVKSTTPLIMHKWSEKAKLMMRDKQQKGTKTKAREIRKPEQEAEEATYVNDHGEVGIPALAFKASLIGAAHKDLGIERTLVRKSLFLQCSDRNQVIAFTEAAEPVIREDMVRVGAGSSDLRYRPEFSWWKAEVSFEIDAELLQPSDVTSLIERAGFGIGICEWRPEKGGEFGRYELDRSIPLHVEELS